MFAHLAFFTKIGIYNKMHLYYTACIFILSIQMDDFFCYWLQLINEAELLNRIQMVLSELKLPLGKVIPPLLC